MLDDITVPSSSSICQPVWQAFEREGKGSFRRERNARGAQGGREGNTCQETIVFFVFNIHQVNVKILIGPSSKHVNHSLNTLIRLAEINITLLSSPISFPFKRLPCRLQHLLVCPMILTSCVTKMLRGGGFQPPFHVPWWGYEFLCMPGD